MLGRLAFRNFANFYGSLGRQGTWPGWCLEHYPLRLEIKPARKKFTCKELHRTSHVFSEFFMEPFYIPDMIPMFVRGNNLADLQTMLFDKTQNHLGVTWIHHTPGQIIPMLDEITIIVVVISQRNNLHRSLLKD
jgi:hypothetical protein